jgi:hypothetical protein
MKLTPKQKEIIENKIGSLISNQCLICSASPILVSDRIFELREFERGDFNFGSQNSILPVISITCPTCGHTYFFNAVILGIVASEKNLGNEKKIDEKSIK